MNINGFFEYAIITMKLVSNCLSGYNKDGKAKWAITFDENQLKMIEHFSYRPTHFMNRTSKSSIHKDIMTHPFYFLLNQHPVVLDFNFLSYMAEFSLTYNFYSFTSLKNSIEYKNFKAFKSMLGKSYYEEFMTDQLLKSIFSGRGCKIFDDKAGAFPDFSITFKEKDIFLFEVKSCDISLDTLENNDGQEFKSFLRDQFAAKSNNGRNKGVYQILSHISKLATTNKLDNLVYNPSKKANCNLYPIIIYTENALDIPGVNGYLNDIFQLEVAIYKSSFKKVYPITVININTLIENFSLLKANPSLLKEWIKGYWERCNSNRKSFEKSKNPNQFLRAGNPFSNYLHQILKDKDPLVNFKTIVEDLELSKE